MKHKVWHRLKKWSFAFAAGAMLAGPMMSTGVVYAVDSSPQSNSVNTNTSSPTPNYYIDGNTTGYQKEQKEKDAKKAGDKVDKEAKKDRDDAAKKEDEDSNSSYTKFYIPSRLSTAYHDGLEKIENEPQNSDSKSKDEDKKSDGNSETIFENDIHQILDDGHFFNVGTLIGPLSLSSANSGTDAVAQNSSAGMDILAKKMVDSKGNPAGLQYYAFGKALNRTADTARQISPDMSSDKLAATLHNVGITVSDMGIKLLDMSSPAPLILGFFNDKELAKKQNKNNILVNFVGRSDLARNIITFFGSPAPAPFSGVSTSWMIVAIIMLFMLGLYAFAAFFSQSALSTWMKKSAVKIVIISAAIPLSMKVYDYGLKLVEQYTEGQHVDADDNALQNNLGLSLWASSNFSMPADVKLVANNGKFVWTPEIVEKINLHSAYKQGYIGSEKATSENKKIVLQKLAESENKDNAIKIQWTKVLQQNDNRYYHTDDLNAVADALGSTQKIDIKGEKGQKKAPTQIGYLDGGMRASGNPGQDGNGKVTYSSDGSRWGFSPISAYNLTNTNFSSNGISIKDNMEKTSMPVIAGAVTSYMDPNEAKFLVTSQTQDRQLKHAPNLITAVLSFLMIFWSIKAMILILTNGIGGLLFGAGRTSLGSPAGAGQLVGGVVALILGVLGVSLLSTFLLQALDIIYGFCDGMLSKVPGFSGMFDIFDSISKWAGSVPFFGKLISAACASISGLISSILTLILGASFFKIPLMAFGQGMASLPDKFAAGAVRMEQRITGDYSTPAGHAIGTGGKLGGAILAGGKGQAAAIRNGASMALGGLGNMFSKNDSVNKDESNKEENKNEEKNSSNEKNNEKNAASEKTNGDKQSIAENKGEKKDSQSTTKGNEKTSSNDKSSEKENDSDTENAPDEAPDGDNSETMTPETGDEKDADSNPDESVAQDGSNAENPEGSGTEDGAEKDANGNAGDSVSTEENSTQEGNSDETSSSEENTEAAKDTDSNPDDSVAQDGTSLDQSNEENQENNQEGNSEQVDSDQSMNSDESTQTEDPNASDVPDSDDDQSVADSSTNDGESDPDNDDIPTSDKDDTISTEQNNTQEGNTEENNNEQAVNNDASMAKQDETNSQQNNSADKAVSQNSSSAQINNTPDTKADNKASMAENKANAAANAAKQFANKASGKSPANSESAKQDSISNKSTAQKSNTGTSASKSQASSADSASNPPNGSSSNPQKGSALLNKHKKLKGTTQIAAGLTQMAGGMTGTQNITGHIYNAANKATGGDEANKGNNWKATKKVVAAPINLAQKMKRINEQKERSSYGPSVPANDPNIGLNNSENTADPNIGLNNSNTTFSSDQSVNDTINNAINAANNFNEIINGNDKDNG